MIERGKLVMGMNIFSYVIMLLGVSIILLGLIIWKKQKITLTDTAASYVNFRKIVSRVEMLCLL